VATAMSRVGGRVLAAAVVLGLAAAACGDGDQEAAGRPCVAVGEDLEVAAAAEVAVTLDDYSITPGTIETAAGTVTFETRNVGSQDHELAFLPGGGEVPLLADGAPDEDALAAAGAFELEAYGPGQRCAATFALAPGDYTVFCVVRAPDGQTHLAKGMKGRLTVR